MIFIAIIFMKLTVSPQMYMDISCAEFFFTLAEMWTTWRSLMPNITQICQEIWKSRVEICLCPEMKYDCTEPVFMKVAFPWQLRDCLYRISWKSNKVFGHWCYIRDGAVSSPHKVLHFLLCKDGLKMHVFCLFLFVPVSFYEHDRQH